MSTYLLPHLWLRPKQGNVMTTWAALAADPAALQRQYGAWVNSHPPYTLDGWLRHMRTQVADPENVHVAQCFHCGQLAFDDRMVHRGQPNTARPACASCYDNQSAVCGFCGERHHVVYMQQPGRDLWPEGGRDGRVCAACYQARFTTCRICNVVYDATGRAALEVHRHRDQSCCESPAMDFAFPLREGTLDPDTRIEVTLGNAGRLTKATIKEIGQYLRNYAVGHPDELGSARQPGTRGSKMWTLGSALYACDGTEVVIGRDLKTDQGTFPTRLKRYAYKERSLKLEPQILTQVGNIISSSKTNGVFQVEVTRDLNLTAAEFGNLNSCWWSNYKASRCALKTNGGLGLRAFNEDDTVAGRVWVMPLKKGPDGGLTPTFATNTGIFFVFNGYGVFEETKTGARVVQEMTGVESVKLIEFNAARYYVNSSRGYLCGPEKVTSKVTSLHLPLTEHAELFKREQALLTKASSSVTAKVKKSMHYLSA